MLKQVFPSAQFADPAAETMLHEAETLIGVAIPEKVRSLYFECDGFREDRGSAQYLFPLFGSSGLVELTKSMWLEFEGVWPEFSLRKYIFFGSSCCDHLFGVNSQVPFNLIQFHHNMEGTFEDHGTDVIKMYEEDYHRFDADAV